MGDGSDIVTMLPDGKVLVKDLRPHPENPRDATPEAMDGPSASLERFGLVENLVVNRRSGYLLSGHRRQEALLLRGLGEEEVRVVYVDLDDEDERLLLVALNNERAQGFWTPAVEDVLARLREHEAFEELGLAALEKDVATPDLSDLDDEPPTPEPTKTRIECPKCGHLF